MPRPVSEMVISRQLFEALLSELLESRVEKAALLFGRLEGDSAVVSRGVVAVNEEESPTHFRVDPTFLLRALEDADARGEELVGLLHVHPAPPEPSAEDLRFMEANPIVWIIASKTGEFAAFQAIGGAIKTVFVKFV